MEVSIEKVTSLGRRMRVVIPADRYRNEVANRIRELSRNVRLAGFRPGKVPPQVIEQRYGQQVRSEAANELIRSTFEQAVGEQKLRPAVSPTIEAAPPAANSSTFEYTASFDELPEIGEIDVAGLEISRERSAIEDTDIDRMIDTLRLQRRTWQPAGRAAQATDLVAFEFTIDADGVRVPDEGRERGAAILGSGAIFTPIEQALYGMSEGDSKTLEVDFPAEYRDPRLAGKHGKVEMEVVKVQQGVLPEIDATFVKSFGIPEGDLETFRREVRANLERELKQTLSARLRTEVVSKLVDRFGQFELPATLVDQETRNLRAQALQNAKRQGMTEAEEAPLEAFQPAAQRRVAAGLLLGELARRNQIKLDQRRVAEEISMIASTYEDPQQVVELYRRDARLMQGVQNRVMEDQVADWIAESAKCTDLQKPFTDIMRPGQ